MSTIDILGLAGSFSVPSRTRGLVEEAVARTMARFGGRSKVVDLSQLGPDFAGARNLTELTGPGRDVVSSIVDAKALIVATPVYKGSYPGLFKHLFDLIDPTALAGKPVLLAATGGGDKHALVIEHHLRPLFAFFEAQTLATGVYASERDFVDGQLSSPSLITRLDRAVGQFAPHLKQDDRDVVFTAKTERRRGTAEAVAANA
ncbi:FMN reductase [Microvirga sp. KLBC 81]|uniref:FMN reductase n=1 Tax=Microvirga sp. KLBC 81 TaxID=1862707 RepID=UPI000D5111E5|nr:FMN reductase [Microvirga sp. KLBC 81]PVE24025.1 FMN reductase [Microvirga sp. KLBC 81]